MFTNFESEICAKLNYDSEQKYFSELLRMMVSGSQNSSIEFGEIYRKHFLCPWTSWFCQFSDRKGDEWDWVITWCMFDFCHLSVPNIVL